MDNQERLGALLSALKQRDGGKFREDVEESAKIIEREVGSIEDIYRTFRHYRDQYPETYKDFCENTKDAIQCVYEESRNRGQKWYPALWDCFAKPEIIADLERWLKGKAGQREARDFGFAAGAVRVRRQRSEENAKYIFRNMGDTWRIVYEGQETTVKDTKGVRYVHYLVQNSNEAKDCFDIEKGCSDAPDRDIKNVSKDEVLEAGLHTEQFNLERLEDFQPEAIIDAKRKLEADMENTDDPSKKMELKDQIQAIEKYLSHDLNIHGRRRPEGKLEKARKRVSNAINTAKKNITANKKYIGQHFQSAIIPEGTTFIYKPDRDIPWILE